MFDRFILEGLTRSRNRVLAVTLILLAAVPSGQARAQGLHGYIASSASWPSEDHTAGMGFYAGVWSLVDAPYSNFQIGLPSTWITPDNHDNTTEPLCPEGTTARDYWPERGPTYEAVFQTMEGGIGYWVGNRFRYGPPKFSINSTPDCYTSQVASPGWPFFGSSTPLPDDFLGIAQLSNRVLIPPDGMTFQGSPHGEFLGYAYMALPLTDARPDPQPTGNQSWTLFLNSQNFKGPVAYFLPETWSRMSSDYNFPFIEHRTLDSRRANRGGSGSMEINSVPMTKAVDGPITYTKIPQLRFPVNGLDRTVLVRDVSYYSRDAIFNDVLAWRGGGDMPTGLFDPAARELPTLYAFPVNYTQESETISGINEVATPTIFDDNSFGLSWSTPAVDGVGVFPQYFADSGDTRVAVDEGVVPQSLRDYDFALAPSGPPYNAPLSGAWATPGPAAGPYTTVLNDDSEVTYYWYRFIDQPVFQQYGYTTEQKNQLQALVEAIHANWTPEKPFMADLSAGTLVELDHTLIVTPPPGLEVGYVPLVVNQKSFVMDPSGRYLLTVKASGRGWCVDDGPGGDQLVRSCDRHDLFIADLHEADGSYRIVSARSGRHLHLDGGGDKLLSTRYQPDDIFTRFFFERQGDGTYRIRVKATGDYLHTDESSDYVLSTRYQVDDSFTRFYLTRRVPVFVDGFESGE
jgi:hypothetical protein